MDLNNSAIDTQEISNKLVPGNPFPMLNTGNVHYEVAKKVQAISWGGLGLMHQLADRLGLAESIDSGVHVLRRHLPYHESDHVLSLAFNVMSGGTCLQDSEAKRLDPAYREALGARRLPAPSTSGDFLRRFSAKDVEDLQESLQEPRLKVWAAQPDEWRERALIDVDGTLAETTGKCKRGMDINYKGKWGYHPLVLSLANSNEVLYTVNRSGNRPSHDGAAPWIDRAVALTRRGGFKKVLVRGDTDFSLTENFDRWSSDGVEFVFGMDACKPFVKRADALPEEDFEPLRRVRPEPKGPRRRKAERVKESIVVKRRFKKKRLVREDVAEFDYRPVRNKCKRTYRMVVLRKRVENSEGQKMLFAEDIYFFYVTNVPREELSAAEVVRESNRRCNQENVIEQLKNGVEAMRMPSDTLESNWAYMAIASLAWNLKAWLALTLPKESGARRLIGMEFRRFYLRLIQIPCQILRRGGRLIYRLLSTNGWTQLLLQGSTLLRTGRLAL